MSRAYLRLDPAFFDRKALDQDYPPAAVAAFVGVLCQAEHQPKRGYFRNRRVLAALLDRYSRWIPFLIERQDLIELADGQLYVDGWEEWQEGDVTVRDRMARLRKRHSDRNTDRNVRDGSERHTPSERHRSGAQDVAGQLPPPPTRGGRRRDGTNPRAAGSAPRQNGEAPRQTGTSTRQKREALKTGPTSLHDILERVAAAGTDA